MSDSKTCVVCKADQPLEGFGLLAKSKDGRRNQCRECRRIESAKRRDRLGKEERSRRHKAYYERNKAKLLENCREYRRKNKPRIQQWMRAYYDTNREHLCAKAKERAEASPGTSAEYTSRRKKEDVQFRLRLTLRNRLLAAVNKGYRAGSAVADLGCSVAALKEHLESRFEPGMSWENYGKGDNEWNIDHIVPLACFDLTNRQHVVLACHFLNLQPLWHVDNIRKGNRYEAPTL